MHLMNTTRDPCTLKIQMLFSFNFLLKHKIKSTIEGNSRNFHKSHASTNFSTSKERFSSWQTPQRLLFGTGPAFMPFTLGHFLTYFSLV